MKIAITGASSTGKTTLSQKLLEKGAVQNFITVDAREIIKSLGFQNIDDLTNNEFLEFQCRWIEKKVEIEQQFKSFITDRSYVDAMSYMISRGIEDKKLFALCIEHQRKYDVILYLPQGKIPFQVDGFRSENMKSHEIVDSNIRALLASSQIPYFEVTSDTIDNRVEEVEKILHSVQPGKDSFE